MANYKMKENEFLLEEKKNAKNENEKFTSSKKRK